MSSDKFKIEAEKHPCPPFLRGIIFYQNGKDVWVVEGCDPLEGKVQLGFYRLPDDEVSND